MQKYFWYSMIYCCYLSALLYAVLQWELDEVSGDWTLMHMLEALTKYRQKE